MHVTHLRTIGISPGTRLIGVAILEGDRLLYSGVKSYKGKWNDRKLNYILNSIDTVIDEYEVSTVILKTIHLSRASIGLCRAIHGLKDLCKRRKMSYQLLTIEDLKRLCIKDEFSEGRDLGQVMADRFPELRIDYHKERINRNAYYKRMFGCLRLLMTIWSLLVIPPK